MPVRAIKPFVPCPDYPWRDLPLDTNKSAIGDFDDPHLETEFRRFHFRDIGATAFLLAGGISAGLGLISLPAASDEVMSLNAIRRILVAGCCGVAVCIDCFAFFRMSNEKRAASWIRLAVLTAAAIACAVVMSITPLAKVVSCGNVQQYRPPKPPRRAGNMTSVPPPKCRPLQSWHNCTTEHREAVARWQRHCVDTIDPWLGTTGFVIAALLRLFLRFSIPALILGATTFSLTYLLRTGPSNTYPYQVRPWDIAADCVIQLVVLAGTVIFAVRFHATHRARFLATARAEQRRLVASDEMERLDGLLRRALPSSVLERMVRHGADINDVSDQVSVMSTGVMGLDAWTQGRATQTSAVQALHYLAVTADAIVDAGPTGEGSAVYRARVSGDSYSVVAGLPAASPFHASAVCQIALALRNAMCRIDVVGGLQQRGDGASERELNFSGAALWAAGNLKVCIGIGSGRAFGCVLGVRCLSYDISGPAVADSMAAIQQGTEGDIVATAETRRQMIAEASLDASPEGKPLFDTPQKAADWFHRASNGDTRFYRLSWVGKFATPESQGGSPLLSSTAAPTGGAVSEAAGTAPPFAEGLDPEANHTAAYAHEKIYEQREELEKRMVFVLAHAANAASCGGSQQHAAAAAAMPVVDGSSLSSIEMRPSAPTPNVHSTAHQRQPSDLLDLKDGPFRRATCFPLLMGFADGDAEKGYLAYARQETAAMRSDLRWVTVCLMLAAGASYIATASEHRLKKVVVAMLALGLFSALVNATALRTRHGERLDTPLACASLGLLAIAVVISATHPNVLGNDGYWLHPISVLLLQLPIWTLSPLARAGVGLPFAAAAVYPLLAAQAGDYTARLISVLSSSIAIPMLLALHESFNRHAYISRRCAEALEVRQASAAEAQQKTLEAVVPSHVVPDLSRWLESGAATPGAIAHCAIHDDAAVLMVQLVSSGRHSLASSSPSAATHAPSLHGHRAVDALLERCSLLVKVRCVGDTVVMAGPLVLDAAAAAATGPSQLNAAALADAVLLLAELEDLGVDFVASACVGVVVGAILGTYRLHYDVRGCTVDGAARMCNQLEADEPETSNRCRVALSATVIAALGGATAAGAAAPTAFTVSQPESRSTAGHHPDNFVGGTVDPSGPPSSSCDRMVRVRVNDALPGLAQRGFEASRVTLQCLNCLSEAL